MPVTADTARIVARMEHAAQHDVGRGTVQLAGLARGGLLAAAQAIAAVPEPRLAFVTGCFIPQATPAAAETDGPVGTAMAAAALAQLGVASLLVTDDRCEPVVRAAAAAAQAPLLFDDDPHALAHALAAAGTTHVVFCERLGPGVDGSVRNMRGDDVGAVTAPLHLLASGTWTTIGIGDGGNEVGMGALTPQQVAAAVPHGEQIRCAVACDHLIVAGVSNWGAIALAAAVALLLAGTLDLAVAEQLAPDRHLTVLRAAVAGGAVDGVRGRPSETVDGVGADVDRKVIHRILASTD